MTLSEDIKEKISQKRLIFTVSTGRNGSAYLSTVMNFCSGVVALHEPTPDYVDVLREVQQNPAIATKFLVERKLPIIAEFPTETYLEGSHLFCKGFLEPCLDLGIQPDLIYFRRDIRKISLSLLKMGTVPGRNEKALRYYLSPEDPGLLQLKVDWNTLEDYQLCYWYCLEIERRAEEYRKLYRKKGLRFVEASIAQLKTMSGFNKLVSELGLRRMSIFNWLRYLKHRNSKINESLETKKAVIVPSNLDELEAQVKESVTYG